MMKALIWCAPYKVTVERVPEPKIINGRDAIVRLTSTCICGSDLHLVDGFIPFMKPGDILGHEPMGIVEEVGPDVDQNKLKKGDRVVVPFPIACGECFFCRKQLYSCCDNTNPKAYMAEQMFGETTAGIFGYSHLTGGYAGGQSEFLRVPLADFNCQKMPADLTDHQLVFLSDIFPTGYMAAWHCNIQPDDTVAIWGCGPVGQFAIASAYMLGAERVIAIDRVPFRLQMAKEKAGASDILNYEEVDIPEALKEITGGRGPDACIDAIGLEAHSPGLQYAYDRAKQALMLETDRPIALRQAIMSCRNGGNISVIGVYSGFIDKFPMGSVMNRSLTIKTGQCHVQRYMQPLLERIRRGEIDPGFVITHRLPLSEAPRGYSMFLGKQDDCVKVVLKPQQVN